MHFRKKQEQGQTLLIIVLVMVIALTVGLSVASRSITNLKTSTEEAESQKALAAAEAGIEQALMSSSMDTLSGNFSTNQSSYQTEVSDVKGTEFMLNAANPILKDEGIDVWFSNYSTNSTELYSSPRTGIVTFYWGQEIDDCKNGALEIALISQGSPDPINDASIKKYAVDPCSARRESNNFDSSSDGTFTVSGNRFYHSYSISVTNGLIARLLPVYSNSQLGVTSTVDLPSQGLAVSSTGSSGNVERKVSVFKSFPRLPSEFFPYNLFTP